MDRLNNISSEELCAILKVADTRSLLSTDGFPKPLFDKNKFFFNKNEVAKFLNVDNIDEPFITLKEAAEYIGVQPPYLMQLANKNEVPSYRLKSKKGSGYLFRKSELDFLNEIKIEGNDDFVNFFVGTDVLRNLFKTFIEHHFKDSATTREYDIVCMYFFNRYSFEKISQITDISYERVRQLFLKAIRRITGRVITSSQRNVIELERQIVHKDIEIAYLKKQLRSEKPDIVIHDGYQNELDYMTELYHNFLSKRIIDEDLSVRALNSLRHSGLFDDYNFNRYNLLTNYNSYNGGYKRLLKLRNLGKKSADEIFEHIVMWETDLEAVTKNSTRDFLMMVSDKPKLLLLYQQVHAKMKFDKNGKD